MTTNNLLNGNPEDGRASEQSQMREVRNGLDRLPDHDHEHFLSGGLEEDVQVDGTPSRPAFPIDVFPEPVRQFAVSVSSATGCPADFSAVAALVASATAIGSARAVQAKPGWVEHAGLFAALVGDPGSGKTPALKAVMQPFYDEQERLYRKHLAEDQCYRERLVDYRQKRNSGELDELLGIDSMPPQPPTPMPHLFTSDATVEAVAAKQSVSPKGQILIVDELSQWALGMNRYGNRGDRQFYLSIWSSAMIKIDRKINRQQPIVIRHPFLCVLGGIQPDVLPTLRSPGSRQDGFLDRILFTFPHNRPFTGWLAEAIDAEVQRDWERIIKRLLSLQPEGLASDSPQPRTLTLTVAGGEALAAFVDRLADEMNTRELPREIVNAFAKFRSYVVRFALVIHMLRFATGELDQDWDEGQVDEEDVRRAIVLCDYFKQHALAVHGFVGKSDEDRQIEALLSWARRKHLTEAGAREITRANVAGIKDSIAAKKLMQVAAHRGHGELEMTDEAQRTPRLVFSLVNS